MTLSLDFVRHKMILIIDGPELLYLGCGDVTHLSYDSEPLVHLGLAPPRLDLSSGLLLAQVVHLGTDEDLNISGVRVTVQDLISFLLIQ